MCTSSRGWVVTYFPGSPLLLYLEGASSQCALGGTSKRNVFLSMHSRPRWYDPLLMWSPNVWPARTNWNWAPWESLGREFSIRIPCLSRCCILARFGQVSWFTVHGDWPRVPSCILTIKRLRTGSALWAWCQLSAVMQATCGPSPTWSRMCRSQLYASMVLVGPSRLPPAGLTWPLQWLMVMCAQSLRHAAQAKTPLTRHLHWC